MRLPKSAQARTALVSLVLVVAALAWEALALATNEQAAWTFSRLVWSLTDQELFVFACGMLAGHFFFAKTKCLQCGSLPYRTGEAIAALFDSRLMRAITVWNAQNQTGNQPDLADVKRRAGFPVEG